MIQNLLPQFQLQEFKTSPKSNSIQQIKSDLITNPTKISLNSSELFLLHNELHPQTSQRAHAIDSHIQFRNNLTTNEMLSSVMNARDHHQRITITKIAEDQNLTVKK